MLQRCASVREALQNDALNLFCKHGSNVLKNGKRLDDTKNNRRAKKMQNAENAALAAKLGADRAENEVQQDPEKWTISRSHDG